MNGYSPPSTMKSTPDIELLRLEEDAERAYGSKRRWVRDVADSFRPVNPPGLRSNSVDAGDWPGTRFYNLKSATRDASAPHLATKLKGRHLQMIAFGGSIGMFVVTPIVAHIVIAPAEAHMTRRRIVRGIGKGLVHGRPGSPSHGRRSHRMHAALHL